MPKYEFWWYWQLVLGYSNKLCIRPYGLTMVEVDCVEDEHTVSQSLYILKRYVCKNTKNLLTENCCSGSPQFWLEMKICWWNFGAVFVHAWELDFELLDL